MRNSYSFRNRSPCFGNYCQINVYFKPYTIGLYIRYTLLHQLWLAELIVMKPPFSFTFRTIQYSTRKATDTTMSLKDCVRNIIHLCLLLALIVIMSRNVQMLNKNKSFATSLKSENGENFELLIVTLCLMLIYFPSFALSFYHSV